jgi:hypothetical protein
VLERKLQNSTTRPRVRHDQCGWAGAAWSPIPRRSSQPVPQMHTSRMSTHSALSMDKRGRLRLDRKINVKPSGGRQMGETRALFSILRTQPPSAFSSSNRHSCPASGSKDPLQSSCPGRNAVAMRRKRPDLWRLSWQASSRGDLVHV